MFLKKALAFILSASMALSASVLPTTASADETSVTIANFDKLYQKVWGGKEQDGHLDSTAGGTVVYAGIADLAGDMTVTLGWGLASGYKVDASVYAMPLLDKDKDGTATAEETDAYYAALSDKPSFTDASANLLASITDYNEGAGWTTYKDVELTTSANSLSGKKAIFFTLSNDGKNNTNGYTGNFTYLNISATNVLGTPAGTCTASVTLTSELAADADAVFNVDVIYYGTSIKSGTVTLESGATTATASITDVPVYSEGAEYTVSITPAGYDFVVDSYDGTITAAVNGTHAVSADIYKVENTSVTLDDTFQASSNTKADLDLVAKAVAKGATSSDLEASEIITVEYDFVPGSASAHGYIDLRSNAGADSCSENADSKRYLITRIYSGWNQVDVADGATKFGGVSDIDNHQKLNIAGKYNSNPTDTYHIKYTINYRTKTMQLDASSTSGSTSAFEFIGFPSADKGSLYMSLYPDTETEKNTWTVSNVKVGYKTAATDSGEPAAKTGKVTTTIDRKVKSVTFTNGDTVETIDATQYMTEMKNASTKVVETTLEEGTYTITTESYAPATYALTTKVSNVEANTVTVTDGSDTAVTVSGALVTEAPATDYDLIKNNTIVWNANGGFKPASLRYIAEEGSDTAYIAGAIQGANADKDAAVYMIVDSKPGKFNSFSTGNDWIQVNTGTTLKVPVAKDTKVSFGTYQNVEGTVDGKAINPGANKYEYYYAGSQGYSEVTINAGSYLGYVKTEPITRKTVTLTVTGETAGTLKFTDDASGDVVYASVTDENVALLPGQTYSISYGTLEDSTFTPSEDKHVTNETKSFTVGDSTTTAAVTIEGGAAAKTGKLTATLDSQVKKVTLTKGETVKEITLSGVTTFEEADFGTYTVSTEAYAPATYTLTPSVESVAITADCDLELEVTSAINTTAPTTNYNTVKGNTIIWDSAKYSAGFKPASFKYLKDIQGVNNVYIAGAVLGENSSADADVYMIADTTNGKLNSANRNDWIQVNGGTKFKIPAAKDAKITITCYKDTGMAGTSDGKEFTSGQTYQYYHFAEADGLSELVLTTSGDYVGYIMSEPMPRKTVAVTVTGGTDGDCVKFTNAVTGDVQYGTIAEGAASVSLLQGFTYSIEYGTKEDETFTASETKALANNSKSLAVSSSTDTATLTVNTLDPSTKHTITIDPSITHGTITTTPAAKADEDDEVTITATRDENYKLKAGSVKVTKTGDDTTEVEVTDGKFTMPAYDVTVTAEFEASTETEGQLYVNGAYTSLETDTTHFKTISEAVAAAKKINPQSEQNRVVINVYPGDYEEQVRMDQMKYVTLQQTPETNGKVNLSWYFCTNYYTSNTDLNGQYDPKIDWSLDETWNGYNEGDEKFTKYTIGQDLTGVSTISYYDTDGVAHKNVAKNSMLDRLGGLAWSYDKMAPLIVTSSSSDITIKDLNLINSTVVMKTKGQDDGHLTPNPSGNLPDHKALSICDETTTLVKPTADIYSTKDGSVDLDKYKAYVASQGEGFKFTPGESAWLLQSSGFNERGHAIAILGDRIICENVRVRGNQDSVWVSDGRTYFKNCDLIGGTDYIYGSASAVFDHCKLGFVGFTDKSYGSPLATPNTPGSRKYGYLFFNCTIYNVRENNGANNFGGPWGVDGQSTFYNTVLDDKAEIGKSPLKIEDKGWGRFGAENGLSRLYEFGTTNNSGAAVDLSKRIVNLPEAEGGPGMGTVLDKWQILEFNPRNVFSTKNDSKWSADWDPMNFASQLADTDAALNSTTVSVPAGNTSEITLPTPTDNNIEFHWESNSTNAIVSEDGTKLTVVRPALGESSIDSSVILYARNKTTGYGDKKEIPVTIAATTDTENVFNIPVTITASVAPEAAVAYAVTIKKGGALIKSQTITMPANSRTVTATIENIPASASGIDYDLKIVPTTDEYSIKTPENGAKTVTGVTGEDVALSVEATKLIDQKTSLSTISYANTSGTQSYDLIALAKAAGADDDIEASDIITIEYDFVPASADAAGYIDLRSNTASSRNTNADNKRFVLERVNSSWHQLDTADCTQGFSGSSNSTHQWLNIAGKYEKGADITTTAHVTTTINYKTQTITQSAIGSGTSKNNSTDPFTFEGFPEASKGSMYLYLYSDGGSWGIQNVSVTYKQLVVQKYTVTITGGEGIEDVKLGTLTGTKSGNTYTFTDVPEGTYDFDVTYTTGYEKADASPASITVSDDKTAETISAKLTEVTPPAPTQVFLDLLQGQNIRIEKKAGADANSVELEVSLAEGFTDVPVPELSAYVAVYDGTALKSVNIVPFTNNKATITKPTVSGTESYKVFIWENGNSSPVIAPITAETTGNNKLF